MSIKAILTINAIVMGVFAYISILLPATVITGYGVEFNVVIEQGVRFSGSILLALALIIFFLKDLEYDSDVKLVVLALLIGNGVGLIVAVWGQISNVFDNNFGWVYIIAFGFLLSTFGYVYFKKQPN